MYELQSTKLDNIFKAYQGRLLDFLKAMGTKSYIHGYPLVSIIVLLNG